MKRLDRPERGGDPVRQGIGIRRQVHSVRVGVAHVGRKDPTAIWRLPDERDPIDGERHTAPDCGMPKSELTV